MERGGTLGGLRLPYGATREELANHPSANVEADCVIFMERIFDHPALMKARHRILIPNPEWVDEQCQTLAINCTQIWHKSQYSLQRLTPVFPQARHVFLGFTSNDPGRLVEEYETFVHLRGKVQTHRNTDSILATWKSANSLPDLYVHLYWRGQTGFEYPGWLHDDNVHIRMGWLKRSEYLELAGHHGIHLCTSEVEGFGHYINEARAMGALIITTNGAPMNELVDDESGILVDASSSSPMNWGIRHAITPEDLAPAIERAIGLSPRARRELGACARERFLLEDRAFKERVRELFFGLD